MCGPGRFQGHFNVAGADAGGPELDVVFPRFRVNRGNKKGGSVLRNVNVRFQCRVDDHFRWAGYVRGRDVGLVVGDTDADA